MNKRFLQTCAIAGAIAASFSVNAETPDSAADVENAFSQCGIGAAIFQNNETAAIISNVIWDLGTTALSSQTSSPSSCSGANKNAAAFIHETYPVLEEELVKGGGAHVAALLEIAGCTGRAQGMVVQKMQADLSDSLSSEGFATASRLEKSVLIGASLDGAISACNA